MYGTTPGVCEFIKRQLGRGDYIGLKRLYTPGP
jgi:hypothetical protein